MFPRNENRNEGTFAKTTLLETALLSPNDPFWCWQKGGFQKGGFGGCSPGTKIKGAQTMKCKLWTETLEFSRLKMPNSRFALHGKRPSLIHGLCAFFASNSRFMRLFQAPLDTCLDSPFLASLSVHVLHFTVYAPSRKHFVATCIPCMSKQRPADGHNLAPERAPRQCPLHGVWRILWGRVSRHSLLDTVKNT